MRRYTQMKFKGWQGGVQRVSCDRFNDEITHHGRKNLIQILPTSTGTVWKVVQQRLYGICRKHNLIENVLVVLLPPLHWEQTELLHLCEVCQLPLSRQEDAPEGHFTRSENYRLPTSFPRKTLYNSRCLSRASSILKESSHPRHHLFERLPSGRCYRCFNTRTNRLKNSFLSPSHC